MQAKYLTIVRRAGVELALEQPVGAFEHDGLQADLVQRVRGLQAEQPATGDRREAGGRALGEGAQPDRVVS